MQSVTQGLGISSVYYYVMTIEAGVTNLIVVESKTNKTKLKKCLNQCDKIEEG
jgi:hypothetical protein